MSRIGRKPIAIPNGVEVKVDGSKVFVKGPKGSLEQSFREEMGIKVENNEINGVGYRVAKQGKQLVMNLGFSHQVFVEEIDGIQIEVPAPNKIIVHGADKQKVGQFAAEIREKRPPEPYKGKGIKYVDEVIIRKEGKAGKGGKKK